MTPSPDHRRVTMSDVALAAHVHKSTVSLALRNQPKLNAATRERIRKIAEELGYRPDPMLACSTFIAVRWSPPGPRARLRLSATFQPQRHLPVRNGTKESLRRPGRKRSGWISRLSCSWWAGSAFTSALVAGAACKRDHRNLAWRSLTRHAITQHRLEQVLRARDRVDAGGAPCGHVSTDYCQAARLSVLQLWRRVVGMSVSSSQTTLEPKSRVSCGPGIWSKAMRRALAELHPSAA